MIKLRELFGDVKFADGYAHVTDQQARQIGGSFLDLEGDAGHQSRLNYLNSITTDKETYNKMYALNEDLLSQKQESFAQAVGTGIKQSVARVWYGDKTELPVPTDILRQNYLETMQDLGIEASEEEKAYAKTTTPEAAGRAVGGVPKLMADFALANKATTIIGGLTTVNNLVKGLRAKKFLVGVDRAKMKLYDVENVAQNIVDKGTQVENNDKDPYDKFSDFKI